MRDSNPLKQALDAVALQEARLTTAVELLRAVEPFLERVPVKTEKAIRAFLRDYDKEKQ